ncbi:hypothetical protein LY78DRAFT_367361 [Colletotrichum sublineola]|nr:hypothetical protein LY78DRAFT_367361 [Colletotrichum sublineola]
MSRERSLSHPRHKNSDARVPGKRVPGIRISRVTTQSSIKRCTCSKTRSPADLLHIVRSSCVTGSITSKDSEREGLPSPRLPGVLDDGQSRRERDRVPIIYTQKGLHHRVVLGALGESDGGGGTHAGRGSPAARSAPFSEMWHRRVPPPVRERS